MQSSLGVIILIESVEFPDSLDEKEVIQKFGNLFRYDNIDNISAEEFQSFLDFKYKSSLDPT